MTPRHVVVVGGGPAGLSAALVLARSGHRVTLVERDRLDATTPDLAFHWERRGIPHFLQPHALIPRARLELRDQVPDVYDAMLGAGAYDVDLRRQLPGDLRPADEALQFVAARRPMIEWALLRAVRREPRVRALHGARVTALRVEDGRVVGVDIDGSPVDADVVADASGRRTARREWLAAAGVPAAPPDRTTDCGVVYYSRYYRLRPGFELPPPKSLLSPRGDLGYLAYATFPGDNRTFAGLLAVPTGVTDWRVLKDAAAFEAAVAEIPALRAWVDPEGVDPITDVLPMAGLRNSIAGHDPSAAVGLFPLGDALCHTDPVLAHGLAFALIHARELAGALAAYGDLGDAGRAYVAAVAPLVEERFDLASALDEQRHRMWTGGPVDLMHRTGDYALFTMAAGPAAALVDPEVFRVVVRRVGLLDSTAVLDDDVMMQQHIEDVFAQLITVPRPAPGPARESLLETATAAGAG